MHSCEKDCSRHMACKTFKPEQVKHLRPWTLHLSGTILHEFNIPGLIHYATPNTKPKTKSIILWYHTRIIWGRFSFLFTLRGFLVSSSPNKHWWHHTFLQHSSFRMLRLNEILIPKMFRTYFSVLINRQLFVISSSYTMNP